MKGKLYLVATPIGNLDDITIRAINVLKEADLIAAEDTRHTLNLLNHLNISKPLISYYKQIENEKSDILISKLEEGKNIALVSDAGTPGISDPGETVVKKAISNNIDVIPIPGACAAINALIASGINTNEFCFIGFLPVANKEKQQKLEENKNEMKTLIFYEAPHKLIKTLEKIKEVLGNRQVALAKEITKIHESFIRGTIEEVILKIGPEPKGEYVLIVEGNKTRKDSEEKEARREMTLEEHYNFYEKNGLSKKDIIKQIAKDRNVPKNEIYKHFI